MIVKFANWIGSQHAKFFLWLGLKAQSNPWWAVALTLWALYEVLEHVAGPVMALLYASGHMVIQ